MEGKEGEQAGKRQRVEGQGGGYGTAGGAAGGGGYSSLPVKNPPAGKHKVHVKVKSHGKGNEEESKGTGKGGEHHVLRVPKRSDTQKPRTRPPKLRVKTTAKEEGEFSDESDAADESGSDAYEEEEAAAPVRTVVKVKRGGGRKGMKTRARGEAEQVRPVSPSFKRSEKDEVPTNKDVVTPLQSSLDVKVEPVKFSVTSDDFAGIREVVVDHGPTRGPVGIQA